MDEAVGLGEQVGAVAVLADQGVRHLPRVGLVPGEERLEECFDRSSSSSAFSILRADVADVVISDEATQRGDEVAGGERGAEAFGGSEDGRIGLLVVFAHADAPALMTRSARCRPGGCAPGCTSGTLMPGRKRKPMVTTAPRRPAPTRVCRTPSHEATGATAAYDSGNSAVETNQSTLETRPSSLPGTRRCFAVAQATAPAASSPLTNTQATANCHVAVARP